MPKSETNSDIENMLSSVRRLVGEEQVPRPREQAEPGKLVLSPGQRVTDDDVLRLTASDVVYVPKGSRGLGAHEDAAASETHPEPDERARARANFAATIAALETEIARTSDQWEPDGVGRDDYSGTPSPSVELPDGEDLDGTGTPVSETSPEGSAEDTPSSGEEMEEVLLDEATLRDMVVEIVQSELQGALGERITGNLRKMVQREIARALEARAKS